MAISQVPQAGTLNIKLQKGTNATGNPVYTTRSYASVKVAATDQQMFDTASAIANVIKYTLVDIIRVNKANLISG